HVHRARPGARPDRTGRVRRARTRHRGGGARPPRDPERLVPRLPCSRGCRMSGAFNLGDPTHSSVAADLLTAFLLGLVHGITPDEHTWPITFSYAIGAYST